MSYVQTKTQRGNKTKLKTESSVTTASDTAIPNSVSKKKILLTDTLKCLIPSPNLASSQNDFFNFRDKVSSVKGKTNCLEFFFTGLCFFFERKIMNINKAKREVSKAKIVVVKYGQSKLEFLMGWPRVGGGGGEGNLQPSWSEGGYFLGI